jgi:glucose uptake protein
MLCWGSWANTQKLAAGSWRFELFYWDYTIGILLLAILFAFTLGSTGNEGRSFPPRCFSGGLEEYPFGADWRSVFNIANILLIAAIAMPACQWLSGRYWYSLILGVIDNIQKIQWGMQ